MAAAATKEVYLPYCSVFVSKAQFNRNYDGILFVVEMYVSSKCNFESYIANY